MNVATVFSFLYISSVPEIKGKRATFSGLRLPGKMCLPSKHTLEELWAFTCTRIFILFLFYFAKIKGKMSEKLE